MIRTASSLSGDEIDLYVRFLYVKAGVDHVIAGELRQVYHVGGTVTLNIDPLCGTPTIDEYSVTAGANVDVLTGDQLLELTVRELIETTDLVREMREA